MDSTTIIGRLLGGSSGDIVSVVAWSFTENSCVNLKPQNFAVKGDIASPGLPHSLAFCFFLTETLFSDILVVWKAMNRRELPAVG